MKTSEIHRKSSIFWLSIKITALRLAMSLETGATDQWKRMCHRKVQLIKDRASLMNASEIRRIERRRGLL